MKAIFFRFSPLCQKQIMGVKFKGVMGLVSLFIALVSCGPSMEEIQEENKKQYHEKLSQFKKDSLDIVKAKFDLLIQYQSAFESIDSVKASQEHKEFKLNVRNDYPNPAFNTLYIHANYYTSSYEHQYPMDSYYHLYNVRRFIEGENLVFDADGDFDESVSKLMDFRIFCHHFVKADYLIIQKDMEFIFPKYQLNDVFEAGSCVGHFALFSFTEVKLLDNFLFLATNAEEVSFEVVAGQGVDNDGILLQDLFNQCRDAIWFEMEKRYTVSGNLPAQGTAVY
ncbi:MAG: hypothetical protein MI810_00435 [Flavobacteriales bacterium]|nr:hypothetical protein [Flavobacteriales bacterium]